MKLQFTNGYRPHFDQISRILQYLLTQDTRKKIPRQDIIVALGIPDNQVENLTSMMTGFGLVTPRISKITPLGMFIVQRDPYFENLGTLWIIHYIVSSNPKWIVWHRIVNKVFPLQDRYDVDKVSNQYFSDLAIHFSLKTISNKLPKEVGAVFATYTRSELSRLNILADDGNGSFIKTNPVDIPSAAFLFCILHFRERFFPGSTAINIIDICQAEFSPGLVFNLPEYQVRTILGDLHNSGLIRLEQFANLDQVRFSSILSPEDILEHIYRSKDAD